MLPHETACKAGAFVVEPHPQEVISASCPGAAPGVSDFGDLSAQLVRNLAAVSNGAASRLRSGCPALAMPYPASGLWPRKREGAPVLDRFQCPGAPFIKMCGPTDSQQLIRLPPSAGPLFTIKNEHHYELL